MRHPLFSFKDDKKKMCPLDNPSLRTKPKAQTRGVKENRLKRCLKGGGVETGRDRHSRGGVLKLKVGVCTHETLDKVLTEPVSPLGV
jgi:hypothetical protein